MSVSLSDVLSIMPSEGDNIASSTMALVLSHMYLPIPTKGAQQLFLSPNFTVFHLGYSDRIRPRNRMLHNGFSQISSILGKQPHIPTDDKDIMKSMCLGKFDSEWTHTSSPRSPLNVHHLRYTADWGYSGIGTTKGYSLATSSTNCHMGSPLSQDFCTLAQPRKPTYD